MKNMKSSTAIAAALVALLMLSGCSSPNSVTLPGSSTDGATDQKPEQKPDKPKGPDGTRANPFPVGTIVENDDWAVTVNSVTFAANDIISAENRFNPAPKEGNEYILVNVTLTYKGDDPDGSMAAFVGIDYVTSGGVTVDSSYAVIPDSLDSLTTLYTGATVSGNIALEVPSDKAMEGVLVIQPGMMADKTFVAVK